MGHFDKTDSSEDQSQQVEKLMSLKNKLYNTLILEENSMYTHIYYLKGVKCIQCQEILRKLSFKGLHLFFQKKTNNSSHSILDRSLVTYISQPGLKDLH